MVLSLLLTLQSATAAAVPADPEIVVLARKLQWIDVDMKLGRRRGRVVLKGCRLTRVSGDAELDAIPCGVAAQCVAEGVATKRRLVTCVEDKANARIDAIVAARRAAG